MTADWLASQPQVTARQHHRPQGAVLKQYPGASSPGAWSGCDSADFPSRIHPFDCPGYDAARSVRSRWTCGRTRCDQIEASTRRTSSSTNGFDRTS